MEFENIINEQLDSMDLSELEKLLDEAPAEMTIADEISVNSIINDLLNGQPIFDSENLMDNIKELFFIEVRSSLILGCEILAVCIIIGLLNNFSNSFGSKTVSSLGTMICGFVIIALCIGSFYQTYNSCSSTMDVMSTTMTILLPIMIPLLISMGGISSGSIMDPVILASVTGFNFIMQHIVLPLIFLSAIFILINSITDKDYVKKLALFMRKGALFITGLTITIFSGITAVQGIMTKSADSLLMKTAKFSIDNFVPIIGGFAADSLDMVINCIGVIKSAVGLIGIVIIISMLAMPVIKIMAVAVIYKITAIAAEPVANKNISDSLNEIGTSAVTMTVVLAAGALMFLIFITAIMLMGGNT
ncbi:MAG: stage III sporulation protein AE [Firmicutes bacterium]|nr:stage III sporulation protein AE [Bacillota bacterium]